jgi:hypothetical protein
MPNQKRKLLEVTCDQQTGAVFDALKNALLKNQFQYEKEIDTTNIMPFNLHHPDDVDGIMPWLKRKVEQTTGDKLGGTSVTFSEVNFELCEYHKSVFRGYVHFINAAFLIAGRESAEEASRSLTESPIVLIRYILLRYVAFALSEAAAKNGWSLKILQVVKDFCNNIAPLNFFVKKKWRGNETSHPFNCILAGSTLRIPNKELSISDGHIGILNCLTDILTQRQQIMLNHQCFHDLSEYFDRVYNILLLRLLSYMQSKYPPAPNDNVQRISSDFSETTAFHSTLNDIQQRSEKTKLAIRSSTLVKIDTQPELMQALSTTHDYQLTPAMREQMQADGLNLIVIDQLLTAMDEIQLLKTGLLGPLQDIEITTGWLLWLARVFDIEAITRIMNQTAETAQQAIRSCNAEIEKLGEELAAEINLCLIQSNELSPQQHLDLLKKGQRQLALLSDPRIHLFVQRTIQDNLCRIHTLGSHFQERIIDPKRLAFLKTIKPEPSRLTIEQPADHRATFIAESDEETPKKHAEAVVEHSQNPTPSANLFLVTPYDQQLFDSTHHEFTGSTVIIEAVGKIFGHNYFYWRSENQSKLATKLAMPLKRAYVLHHLQAIYEAIKNSALSYHQEKSQQKKDQDLSQFKLRFSALLENPNSIAHPPQLLNFPTAFQRYTKAVREYYDSEGRSIKQLSMLFPACLINEKQLSLTLIEHIKTLQESLAVDIYSASIRELHHFLEAICLNTHANGNKIKKGKSWDQLLRQPILLKMVSKKDQCIHFSKNEFSIFFEKHFSEKNIAQPAKKTIQLWQSIVADLNPPYASEEILRCVENYEDLIKQPKASQPYYDFKPSNFIDPEIMKTAWDQAFGLLTFDPKIQALITDHLAILFMQHVKLIILAVLDSAQAMLESMLLINYVEWRKEANQSTWPQFIAAYYSLLSTIKEHDAVAALQHCFFKHTQNDEHCFVGIPFIELTIAPEKLESLQKRQATTLFKDEIAQFSLTIRNLAFNSPSNGSENLLNNLLDDIMPVLLEFVTEQFAQVYRPMPIKKLPLPIAPVRSTLLAISESSSAENDHPVETELARLSEKSPLAETPPESDEFLLPSKEITHDVPLANILMLYQRQFPVIRKHQSTTHFVNFNQQDETHSSLGAITAFCLGGTGRWRNKIGNRSLKVFLAKQLASHVGSHLFVMQWNPNHFQTLVCDAVLKIIGLDSSEKLEKFSHFRKYIDTVLIKAFNIAANGQLTALCKTRDLIDGLVNLQLAINEQPLASLKELLNDPQITENLLIAALSNSYKAAKPQAEPAVYNPCSVTTHLQLFEAIWANRRSGWRAMLATKSAQKLDPTQYINVASSTK